MAKRDYYEVLGVARGVSDGDLKKAYRKLAMEHHPDRNPGDTAAEEAFKEISEAYAVLSDGEKRAQYDRFGHQAPGGGFHGQGMDFGDLGGFTDLFENLFGDAFGGSGGGRRRRAGRGQRGADLRYNLEIDLEQVLTGFEQTLDIPKMRGCEPCSGSGAAEGTRPQPCGRCGGSGQMMFQQGFFRVNRPCEMCSGAGEVVSDPCTSCRGTGRVEGEQTLEIKVPAGVDDGARLRLSGEGEAGLAGGPAGDLYVVMHLRKHELFERDATDLHCEVPITFAQAALGAEIDVPTLEGRVKMQVPEGTQSGKMLRLRGKGLPPLQPRGDRASLERLRGDLYVRIFVEVPTKLSERQREILEEFARETGTEVSPASKGFVDKLREASSTRTHLINCRPSQPREVGARPGLRSKAVRARARSRNAGSRQSGIGSRRPRLALARRSGGTLGEDATRHLAHTSCDRASVRRGKPTCPTCWLDSFDCRRVSSRSLRLQRSPPPAPRARGYSAMRARRSAMPSRRRCRPSLRSPPLRKSASSASSATTH